MNRIQNGKFTNISKKISALMLSGLLLFAASVNPVYAAEDDKRLLESVFVDGETFKNEYIRLFYIDSIENERYTDSTIDAFIRRVGYSTVKTQNLNPLDRLQYSDSGVLFCDDYNGAMGPSVVKSQNGEWKIKSLTVSQSGKDEWIKLLFNYDARGNYTGYNTSASDGVKEFIGVDGIAPKYYNDNAKSEFGNLYYDTAGRVILRDCLNADSINEWYTEEYAVYDYDSEGRVCDYSCFTDDGKMYSSEHYEYDENGDVLNVTKTIYGTLYYDEVKDELVFLWNTERSEVEGYLTTYNQDKSEKITELSYYDSYSYDELRNRTEEYHLDYLTYGLDHDSAVVAIENRKSIFRAEYKYDSQGRVAYYNEYFWTIPLNKRSCSITYADLAGLNRFGSISRYYNEYDSFYGYSDNTENTHYSYDQNGRVLRIEESTGYICSFEYIENTDGSLIIRSLEQPYENNYNHNYLKYTFDKYGLISRVESGSYSDPNYSNEITYYPRSYYDYEWVWFSDDQIATKANTNVSQVDGKTLMMQLINEKKHIPADAGKDLPDGQSIMFRLYNPNSGEHFYTGSVFEGNHLVDVGWNYEGYGWIAPNEGAPVYRLYNENAGDHHYTLSAKEKDFLVSEGWKYEGIAWYSSTTDTEKPLYRLYNPNATSGSHHYTLSKSERDHLESQGWQYEGISWYAE